MSAHDATSALVSSAAARVFTPSCVQHLRARGEAPSVSRVIPLPAPFPSDVEPAAMPVLQLKPRDHDLPVCERYDDEAAVVRYERAMREHRAFTEPFRLERADERVDATWFVSGTSANAYAVDLVDGDLHDACTCPDFLSSGLGTCKHIEAVRRAVSTRPKLRRALARVVDVPFAATLTVVATGTARLHALGRWTPAQYRALGLERLPSGALRLFDADALATGAQRTAVRVTHGAALFARRLAERERLAARQRDVLAAIDSNRLGLDVLSEPLFPYQRTGVRFLVGAGRGLLADDMGLGKTVQTLAACELLRLRGEAARILVVTSASLKDQWAREIKRYARSEAVVVSGGAASRRAALESDAPYKILNYELTWRELTSLQNLDADVLILDEAQRAKNFRTKTATTLRAIPSRFLFVLTGTPVENRLDDLYALLQLADAEVLGPLWRFNLRFHQQNARGRVEGYKNLAALRETIAPLVLRRRKEEVLLQLPALTEQTRYIALTKEQAELEAGCRHDAAKLMRITEYRALTPDEQKRLMALLLKARQACNAAVLCDPGREDRGSPKLDEFESLVGEIVAQGTSKVLVFSEWREMLKLAAERLEAIGVGYAMLHGGIASDRRPALLEKFRESPDVRVLLSTDAGGTGLNLQVASYVIHLDLPWNPGRLDQRTARAHRLGQTRGVSVTYLCAAGGIERGIEGTLAGKRAVRGAALDVASDVDELVAPSFSMFIKEMSAALKALEDDAEGATEEEGAVEAVAPPPDASTEEASVEEGDGGDGDVVAEEETTASEAAVAATTETVPEATTETGTDAAPAPMDEEAPTTPTTTTAATPRRIGGRAGNRLHLAQVVLAAGFPSDAVRAAYEALGAAIGALLTTPPTGGHSGLVAAIYRELIPGGRLPHAAHAALAQLHDLTSLDAHGIEVDEALARSAVTEATQWVERLDAGPPAA